MIFSPATLNTMLAIVTRKITKGDDWRKKGRRLTGKSQQSQTMRESRVDIGGWRREGVGGVRMNVGEQKTGNGERGEFVGGSS